MGSLRQGFGWNTVSQGVTALSALLVVPLIIGRIGLPSYGAFTLANSLVGLLQALDGGMLNAATRYFGIAAGARDQRQQADYFITISASVLMISCLVGTVLFLLAPQVAGLFQLSRPLADAVTFAIRVSAIVLPIGMFQGVVSALLTARGRFDVLACTNVAARLGYVAAVVVFVSHHEGVQTLMRILLGLQIAIVLMLLPTTFRLIELRTGRLLSRSAIREIVGYSSRIQLAAVTALVNLQADALIVGAILPARYVGLYGAGATVATQLRTVPLNFSGPLVARLTRTLGGAGADATFAEYARIQILWVNVVAGFSAVTVGASLFQVEAWLGPRFLASGIVATALGVANFINLLTLPLTVYLQAIGRPDLDLRYGVFGAGLNLAFTGAFIWVGIYGVVGGTVAGQVIASVSLLWLARSAVSSKIPSFLTPIPWVPVIVGGAVATLCGSLLESLVTWHGATALIVVSACDVPGAYAFGAALLGPRRAIVIALTTVRSRSLDNLMLALSASASD